jgi:hypothetical protein
VLRRLEKGRELWKNGRSTIPRPAGSMTAVKKPSGELIGIALDELAVDVERRSLSLMVGDQHFTDVAGANLAGIRSAKVQTIAPGSFPLPAIPCASTAVAISGPSHAMIKRKASKRVRRDIIAILSDA